MIRVRVSRIRLYSSLRPDAAVPDAGELHGYTMGQESLRQDASSMKAALLPSARFLRRMHSATISVGEVISAARLSLVLSV